MSNIMTINERLANALFDQDKDKLSDVLKELNPSEKISIPDYFSEQTLEAFNGKTSFQIAIKFGLVDLVTQLAEEYNISTKIRSTDGSSPVMLAVEYNQLEALKELLRLNFVCTIRDKWRNTPLSLSKRLSNKDMTVILKNHKCLLKMWRHSK